LFFDWRAGVRPDKSLSPFEIRLYRHYRVVHGVRIALAFILTFLLVRLLNVPEGTWPLITLVVIMGPISFWGNVVPRAFERIGGTICGSALGLVALKLELISLPLMVIWCAGPCSSVAGWRWVKTLSGITYRYHAVGCGWRAGRGYEYGVVAKRRRHSGLFTGNAVHRYLAAASLPALAHSNGELRYGL
jgi:hypothetical protein